MTKPITYICYDCAKPHIDKTKNLGSHTAHKGICHKCREEKMIAYIGNYGIKEGKLELEL